MHVFVWLLEELLLVKVSFEPRHFPSDADPKAVGYDPVSCLVMYAVSSSDIFLRVQNPAVLLLILIYSQLILQL